MNIGRRQFLDKRFNLRSKFFQKSFVFFLNCFVSRFNNLQIIENLYDIIIYFVKIFHFKSLNVVFNLALTVSDSKKQIFILLKLDNSWVFVMILNWIFYILISELLLSRIISYNWKNRNTST